MSLPDRAPRAPRPQHVLEVLGTERIAPSLVRVRLGGKGFATFAPNDFTDAYVKLLFAKPELGLEPPYDMEALRATLDRADLPVTRTYSVRAVHEDGISLDFVVHGDEGLAGRWAATVQPGERIALNGPGGAFSPDTTADWHLFVGDESALPAIARAIEALPATATGIAVIEIRDASEEIAITGPAGLEVRWVHRGAPRAETIGLLAETVGAIEWPEGRVDAFVHGERESIKALRDELFGRRGLDRSQVSISGYWAQGRAEDRFQAEKREPVGQLFPAESAVGAAR